MASFLGWGSNASTPTTPTKTNPQGSQMKRGISQPSLLTPTTNASPALSPRDGVASQSTHSSQSGRIPTRSPYNASKKPSGHSSSSTPSSGKKPPPLEGYLNKQDSNMFRTWSVNWFTLEGDRLFYYRDRSSLEHKGCIDLVRIERIQFGDGNSERPTFHIETPERTYHLQAESEADRDYWIYGLVQWMLALGCKNYKRVVAQLPPLPSSHSHAQHTFQRPLSASSDSSDLTRASRKIRKTASSSSEYEENGTEKDSPVSSDSTLIADFPPPRRPKKERDTMTPEAERGEEREEEQRFRQLQKAYKELKEQKRWLENRLADKEEETRLRDTLLAEEMNKAQARMSNLRADLEKERERETESGEEGSSTDQPATSTEHNSTTITAVALDNLIRIEQTVLAQNAMLRSQIKEKDQTIEELKKQYSESQTEIDDATALKKRSQYLGRLMGNKHHSAYESNRGQSAQYERVRELLFDALWREETGGKKMSILALTEEDKQRVYRQISADSALVEEQWGQALRFWLDSQLKAAEGSN